jgi:hypothetical protein
MSPVAVFALPQEITDRFFSARDGVNDVVQAIEFNGLLDDQRVIRIVLNQQNG